MRNQPNSSTRKTDKEPVGEGALPPPDMAFIRSKSDKLSEKFYNLLPPLKVHNASEAAM